MGHGFQRNESRAALQGGSAAPAAFEVRVSGGLGDLGMAGVAIHLVQVGIP
jgi:hypothetical protein